jgi:hypothetical protein
MALAFRWESSPGGGKACREREVVRRRGRKSTAVVPHQPQIRPPHEAPTGIGTDETSAPLTYVLQVQELTE